MTKYTVIGSSGFIGKNVCDFLRRKNESVLEVNRILPSNESPLGTVIYCAGFGNCLEPENVLDANFTYLSEIVDKCNFERIFYISSTRLYLNCLDGFENASLLIFNEDKRSLFNLTKLMAEKFYNENPKFVSLRLSNVYGNAFKSTLFLPSIIRDAILHSKVKMFTGSEYAKDYINIKDVCNAIYLLSKEKELSYNLYNIASSTKTSAGDILHEMSKHILFDIEWNQCVSEERYPEISIERLKKQIDFNPSSVLDDIKDMSDVFKKHFEHMERL
ncbi:NAD-dependent epimerase/dehydratase family protein [Aeromonas caviae]|uniref:NAD-dependent epimerase/dehydratase family protein n=1 Tax=Aeromonas caviae TaxID=648 RepID=UPI00244796F2|nr:NAD-dependent epimerase/dehydratase family protein [Aeromonas caviae]MDH0351909.1 NAD-dependent epimerase/dehydratase family protein [Aeromonas caviae]